MDDNRVPPTDLSPSFYPNRGAWVTQEQLHGEMSAFRQEMREGFKELRESIKEVAIDAREAHTRMREDWTQLLTTSTEHEGSIKTLFEARKADIETRRWFWPQVIAVAMLGAGVFMWLADKLQWRTH